MADTSISGIYEIVNRVNGKRYVGSAVNIRARWAVHRHMLHRGYHHSRHLQASWNKHGRGAFEFRIIRACERADLIPAEQSAIDTMKPEYNCSPVAGRAVMSEDGRRRLSESMLGNKRTLGLRHSPETLALMSEAKKGNTATKGKKRCPDAVAATAAAHRGMRRSAETRAKIAASKIGIKLPPRSEEHRAQISAAHKGRPKAPEHLAALQAGRSRRVYTDEQRVKIGEKSRAAWARRRAETPE